MESQSQKQRNADDNSLLIADCHFAQMQQRPLSDQLGKEAWFGAEPELSCVLKKQGNADRGDQHGQPGGLAKGTICQSLDQISKRRCPCHRASQNHDGQCYPFRRKDP